MGRKRSVTRLLALLLGLHLAVLALPARAAEMSGRVVGVIDGDTIDVLMPGFQVVRIEPDPAQHEGGRPAVQPKFNRAMYRHMTYNTDIMSAIRERHSMAQAQAQQPVTISIRAKAGQRDLIDQAADRLGRSRSDFMLEAACRQAEDVLLDQTYFALDAKSFSALQAMLDMPPAPTDRLRRTLNARAPWETATDKAVATAPSKASTRQRMK